MNGTTDDGADRDLPGIGEEFRSARSRANVTVILLGAAAGTSALSAILDVAVLRATWQDAAAGEAYATVRTLVLLSAGASVAFLAVYLATGISFMAWLNRSMRNGPALAAGPGAYRPAWAIGAWLLPIVNLILPYRLVRDLATRVAEPEPLGSDARLLRTWWAAFVLANVAGVEVVASINDVEAMRLAAAVQSLFSVVGALLAIGVVRRVQRLADAREALLRGDARDARPIASNGGRRLLVAAVAVAVLGLSGIALARPAKPAQADWVRVTPAGRGFSVAMPREPKETTSSVGVATTHRYAVTVGTAESLLVETFDFPVGALSRTDPEGTLDRFISSITRTATPLSDVPVLLGDTAGREVRLRLPTGALDAVRVYVVADRIYALEATTISGPDAAADAARFLDSFELR